MFIIPRRVSHSAHTHTHIGLARLVIFITLVYAPVTAEILGHKNESKAHSRY